MENSAPVVIIAPINLQWLAHFAGAAGRRAGTSVSLIDGKGTVLTRYPNWGAPGMKMADHPLASAMLQQDEGFITTADIDNVHRIFAYVAAPSTGAHIAVGLDEAEILSRIDHQIYVAYAQLAIFGLLTLFLAWSAGERLIVGPIRLLARKAARVGRGEFDTHVEKNTWMAEFGSLAAALDDMTRKLAEREQELHSANRHLTALAASDSLSGLANRRSFDARLESEWQIAAEFKRPIALLMIDVDHFKLFNDRYGHVEGDNCLRGVAEVLAAMASGEADFAARYGGEEFALLLPGVAMETAVATAGRLRRRIEKLGIAHTETPAGTVTISIGVAAFVPRQNDKAEKLVEAADIGLYAAKRRGRNAVVAHAPVALAEAG
jgi:diguanylate cyclase (GGDEF)-like protein